MSQPLYPKKKLPLFYTIYLSCILVFILILCFGVAYVKTLLTEYELVQPKYVAQEIFDRHFTDFSYENMREYYDVQAFLTESGYATEEELFAALNELTKDGEPSFYRSSSGIGDTVEYSVTANKRRVASFTLKKSEEKTENGFHYYTLDAIKVYNLIRAEIVTSDETNSPTFLYTYQFVAPLTHKITVNGQVLTQSQQKGEIVYDKQAMASCKEGFEGIPMITYELVCDTPPTVEATDGYGKIATPEFDEKTHVYRFPVTFDTALQEQFGPKAIEITQKLAKYMQAAVRFSAISPYYDPSTALYQQLKEIGNDSWMVIKYDSCDFENPKVLEAYSYSDTDFSIRVSMVMIGHKAGKDDSKEILDYTFCFHLVDGEWLLYDSYNN